MNISLHFITPLFCKGAYDDQPEIRAPSIRGQLHWWLRALGGSALDEREVFGSVHKDFGRRGAGVSASRVVVRVSNVEGDTTREFPALKHKDRQAGKANPRRAFAPGATCTVSLLERYGGVPGTQKALWTRTIHAWLLLGTLGLRATRAAGSFKFGTETNSPITTPQSVEDYAQLIERVTKTTPIAAYLLDTDYRSGEEARHVVSDTIGGRDDKPGQSDLQKLNDPLGRVFGGRKTSPLRFRIVCIDGRFRIAAIWDGRTEVTGNTSEHLRKVIDLLAEQKPALGQQLANSPLSR